MGKVRIVGGGVTGILAALEAHRLGCRDIVLHERFDTLGGEDAPLVTHGLDLFDEVVDFGPREGAARRLLEWHGVAFEDHEVRWGAVLPGPDGTLAFELDSAGPSLAAEDICRLSGTSLADRLRAAPQAAGEPLTRYAKWRVAAWLDQVHESAAIGLGMTAGLRPALSTPCGGPGEMYRAGRRALESLGVSVRTGSLVSPLEALAAAEAGEAVIWAADPQALFRPLRVDAPCAVRNHVASQVFKAGPHRRSRLVVRNFTASGVIDRLHLYESRGQTLLAVECVGETDEPRLRREIARLMAGFQGETLNLGEALTLSMRPRRDHPSVDGAQKLAVLEDRLARACGPAFIPAWGIGGHDARVAQVRRGLCAAVAHAASRPAQAA
jgi:hypothetical protein